MNDFKLILDFNTDHVAVALVSQMQINALSMEMHRGRSFSGSTIQEVVEKLSRILQTTFTQYSKHDNLISPDLVIYFQPSGIGGVYDIYSMEDKRNAHKFTVLNTLSLVDNYHAKRDISTF